MTGRGRTRADAEVPVHPHQHPPHAPDAGPRLVLLGEPRVEHGEALSYRLERREAALFALLILEGPQARPAMAELVWPDALPHKALSSLRQRLYRLRRATGHALISDDGPMNLADGVAHDLHPDQGLTSATAELELLGAHHYPPEEPLAERVQHLRDRWRLRRAEALARAADAAEDAQQFDHAAALAERLLLVQPASESTHRRCMRLHYLRGDRAQALAAYTRCRTRLRELVGLAPDMATQSLARLIESSTLAAPRVDWDTARVALTLPPRLVGREVALARLRSAWDRRRVIVLRGEAGIGKSRLALEFGRARGTLAVLKAVEEERRTPYAWLARWLRSVGLPASPIEPWIRQELARVVPEWGEPGSAALEAPRLRQGVAALLAATDHRHEVSLFDDVQWIDDASLAVLLSHLDEIGRRAPRVMLCVRDGPLLPRLAAWLEPDTQQAEVITLDPLDDRGVRELLESLHLPDLPIEQVAPAASSLMRLSGGHPQVLLELLRAGHVPLQDDAPKAAQGRARARLQELLSARLGQFHPARQQLLQLAAMAGTSASLAIVLAAAGQNKSETEGHWRALVDAQLIQVDGTLSDAVRDAALAGLAAPGRRALALALVPVLVTHGALPERLAALWEQGGDWARAAECWQRAARGALRLSRRMEELVFWDQAARSYERAGEHEGAWQARAAAVAVGLLVEDARALARRIDALLAAAETPERQLLARLAEARARLNANEGSAALEAAAHALALALQLGDERGEVAATAWHGLALTMTGEAGTGIQALTSGKTRALAQPDLRIRLDFLGALGHALHLVGRYDEAMVELTAAAVLAEQLHDLGEAFEHWGNVATCANSLGRVDDAILHGERALQFWHRLDRPRSVAAAAGQSQLAASLMGVGRFAEAQSMLEWALGCFVASGTAAWRAITEHRLATLYLRLGQAARARRVLSPLAATASAGLRMTRRLIECRIDHHAGRSITTPLRELAREFVHEPREPLARMDRHALLLTLAAHVSNEEAATLARQVLHEAQAALAPSEASVDGPAAVHARARLALALAGLRQTDEAAREARQAWSQAAQVGGLDVDRGNLYLLIHRAAALADDVATAESCFCAAESWVQRSLPHVPEGFRSSFLRRNRMHRVGIGAASAKP